MPTAPQPRRAPSERISRTSKPIATRSPPTNNAEALLFIPMPRRTSKPRNARKAPKTRGRRSRFAKLWPTATTRRRWWRAFSRAPTSTKLLVTLLVLGVVWLGSNWLYQVSRKPSELFFPVSGALYKSPTETWHQYGPLFRKYSTTVISAEFLAAIAQVEGSGNPIVRTYWRFSWGSPLFEMYRPASSAVGMYQITDGTFAEARRYCIRDHAVVMDGPWDAWRSCWFNSLYARVIPSHAVELASAYLDRRVTAILERNRRLGASGIQKQNLAALVHLCGAGAGDEYAHRDFRLIDGQRCGDHLASAYIGRVSEMAREFARLEARAPS